ncbi:Atu4866 domain-containing protein [Neorhizobium alkalisoli]|uniref:Atu4866 domain-containing protein n=1 Tax=Neorhizobium alkalisoli TaxID=528178 RepID=UPI000CF981B4
MDRRYFILTAAASLGAAFSHRAIAEEPMNNLTETRTQSHPYAGMWVTEDGYIRHELLPNGRYDEARGTRKSAYQGRYTVTGNHIDYWDDTGFTADGEFIDGVLHHAGMILHREK